MGNIAYFWGRPGLVCPVSTGHRELGNGLAGASERRVWTSGPPWGVTGPWSVLTCLPVCGPSPAATMRNPPTNPCNTRHLWQLRGSRGRAAGKAEREWQGSGARRTQADRDRGRVRGYAGAGDRGTRQAGQRGRSGMRRGNPEALTAGIDCPTRSTSPVDCYAPRPLAAARGALSEWMLCRREQAFQLYEPCVVPAT